MKRIALCIFGTALFANMAWGAGLPKSETVLPKSETVLQCWGSNSQGQTNVPADLKMKGIPADPVEVRTMRGATCVLGKSKTVSCFGVPSKPLAKLEALTGVSSFSISSGGACAIASGRVQCFSGLGDTAFETVPKLNSPQSVLTGGSFVCAQDKAGVSCWGGKDSNLTTVPALKNPHKLVVSYENACALDDNGVQCWGGSDYTINSVATLNKPTDLFIAAGFACALDQVGVECWGDTVDQQLPPIPTIPNPTGHAQFVTGLAHVCALDQSGVHCWGDGTVNQLSIPALSHPTLLYGDSGGNQTCALDDSGLKCWGEDQAGQSTLNPIGSLAAGVGNTCVSIQGNIQCWGAGSAAMNQALPVTDAYQVVTGSNFACSMDLSDTSANSCWGENQALQSLSPGLPAVDFSTANAIVGIAPPIVTAGFLHACAYLPNQSVISCWGNNDFGQSKIPANVTSSGNAGALSAGGYHTCAIAPIAGAPVLQCWGKNEFGQAKVPATLKNVRQVSAGFAHTCALDDNGVTCWGRSSEGQTSVPPLKNPRLVQAGGYHSCAIDDDGLKCWGENGFGQAKVPVNFGKQIGNLSLGLFHTCAVAR